MRNEIITEEGERKADGSVRFNANPPQNTNFGVMEMVHNMVGYGKEFGIIRFERQGDNLYDISFRNDAESSNLPTYERFIEISKTAGSSISTKKGVSCCGMGTEIMGLRSRPHMVSTVICDITVVRDHMRYGTTLTFNGLERQISYHIKPLTESETDNFYQVKFEGCYFNPNDLDLLKKRIVDTMPYNFNITLYFEDKCYHLEHEDFLYRNKLKGTKNYVEYNFHLKNGEPLNICIADVKEIVTEGNGNDYEEGKICAPKLSGGCIRYNGIATVCRGDDGWGIIGINTPSTKHNVRWDLNVGETVFNHFHKESQVKIQCVTTLNELKDEYRDTLTVYDENDNEFTITDIVNLIKKFAHEHRGDQNSEKNKKDVLEKTENRLKCCDIILSDIQTTLKVIGWIGDEKDMTVKTLNNLLNQILQNKSQIKIDFDGDYEEKNILQKVIEENKCLSYAT